MAEIPLTDPQCERLPLDWGRDLCTLNLVKPFVDSSDGNWRGNHGCTDTALRTKYAVISMFHPMIRGWQRIVKSPQTDVPGSYLILSVRATGQRSRAPVCYRCAHGSAPVLEGGRCGSWTTLLRLGMLMWIGRPHNSHQRPGSSAALPHLHRWAGVTFARHAPGTMAAAISATRQAANEMESRADPPHQPATAGAL